MNGSSLGATLSSLSCAWSCTSTAVGSADPLAFHGWLLALQSAVLTDRLTLVAADTAAKRKELVHM